jgi:hypothetical protein
VISAVSDWSTFVVRPVATSAHHKVHVLSVNASFFESGDQRAP